MLWISGAFDTDTAVKVINNAIYQRQAKPRALTRFFGGKERVKDLLLVFLANTAAAISDVDIDLLVAQLGIHNHGTLLRAGVPSIAKQINKNLQQTLASSF